METAWPLLIFLAGLFGSGLLILICGIQSHEAAEEGASERASERAAEPALSFFERIDAAFACPPVPDADVVRDFERHVRKQHEVAARFIQFPSIGRLHEADTEPTESEMSLFCRIQKYLELERQLVGEFVSDPSLRRLHGRLAAAV